MNWTRAAVITTISAGIAGAIYYSMRPQPLEVEATAVHVGPLEITAEEEGKTRLRDRFLVSAPVAGMLRRHNWKVGDTIPAGVAIAHIAPQHSEPLDPRRRSETAARLQAASAMREGADARLRSAEEQLKGATADAEYWATQLAREEKLLSKGDIPSSRIDHTRMEVKRTEAARLAATQAISLARSEIDRARAEVAVATAAASSPATTREGEPGQLIPIQSPVAGRVVSVLRQSEGAVTSGEAILEIGNTRALEVEVELLSADAVKVAPATPVHLSRWGGEGTLDARVRLVEPTGFTKVSALGVEEQRVRVIADLTSPEKLWQRLGDGYRVEASFVLWSGDRVLQIPASAVFRDAQKYAAYVVAAGFVRKRSIEVGHRNGLAAEILSGLTEGELVLPHPDEKIVDGAAVKVIDPKR